MKLRMKLAALAMAGGTAALVLAGSPALASMSVTGPEIAYGAVYGKPATANNPIIPLKWRGLVHAHGGFSPNGPAPKKGQHHTFATSAGNLVAVVIAKPTNTQSFNVKACHFAFTTRVVFAVCPARAPESSPGQRAMAWWWSTSPGTGRGTRPARRRASATPARTRPNWRRAPSRPSC